MDARISLSLSLSDLIHNTELPLIVLRRASLCAVEWIKASSFKKREGQHAPHPFGNDVLPNMHANNQQACLLNSGALSLLTWVTALFHRIINIKIYRKKLLKNLYSFMCMGWITIYFKFSHVMSKNHIL